MGVKGGRYPTTIECRDEIDEMDGSKTNDRKRNEDIREMLGLEGIED